MKRHAAALAAILLSALAASACETTQDESAKIGRKLGKQSADAGTTKLGAPNRQVRVGAVQLIAGNPGAVAVELVNSGATPQAAIPIRLAVRDATGTTVYSNDTKGIDPSLQELGLLAAHATAWWVDNEVLASGAAAATAQVGAATATAPASPPTLSTAKVSASDSFPGPHVDTTLKNTGAALPQLAVYAVTIANGHVVGAGRAVLASLAAGASTPVEIPMTGRATGGTITLTVAP